MKFLFADFGSLIFSFFFIVLVVKQVFSKSDIINGVLSKVGLLMFVLSFLICVYTNISKERIGAVCDDGWNSSSTGSGTCSQHGGVNNWKYNYWFD